ncbi:MAG TPA: hypothetical protein VFV89_12055 [Nocardioides sp.]|uniref:hypothetical protein n=1 Tax=Nocardioides sp. TaxID=35761 RepID=UPI002E3138B8|nr:hypothetical protein [Nocardioides sp.]HEX5088533.1 hypothetical protein [Nocardioides sp.]
MEHRSALLRRGVHFALAILCAFGLVAALPAVPAQATNYEGCSWGHPGISYVNNTSSAYQSLTSAALVNWSNQTDMSFNAGGSNPGFSITDGGFGNTGWDGITYYSCSGGIFVKGMLVRINGYYADAYSGQKKRAVIGHELGHVVGLADRNIGQCPNRSIMWGDTFGRYDVCGIFTVQADDIQGANTLY